MQYLTEFIDYFVNLDLSDNLKIKIKEWLRKYEALTDIHNSDKFPQSIEDIVTDVMNSFSIYKDKRDAVRSYINELYNLSSGISVIMAPDPQMVYNQPDQVQHLYY